MALAHLWKLQAGRERMTAMAAALGSDVPFFLTGGTALGVGRGEEIYPLPDAPGAHLAVAWGAAGMPTAEAYRIVDERLTAPRGVHTIQPIVRGVVSRKLTEKNLFNRFEEVAALSGTAREAESVREALRAAGATRVLLAGSGAAWAGFFPTREAARAAAAQMVRRGFSAVAAATVERGAYWEQALPGIGKEWLP
jgi:4-diphosphocytidyl-2-C-methyl-D-erythritol kinase